MIILSTTSSRLTIVNHLRQTNTLSPFKEPMEVRLALCALEQSYCNHSMTADDRRRAIQSARWTAATLAPAETLSPALREQVEAARRRQQEEADRAAAYRATHNAEVAEAAAKLTADEIAALPARIAHHFAIADNGVTGKSGRKRHRQQGRALQEILDAATKVVTA